MNCAEASTLFTFFLLLSFTFFVLSFLKAELPQKDCSPAVEKVVELTTGCLKRGCYLSYAP
jgi:hypothetical protein